MLPVHLIAFAATAIFFCSAATPTETSCGLNEAKYPCGKRCEARCNAEIPHFCRGIRCLGFSCRCKNGYARNPETGECLKMENCPASRCASGEYLTSCGKACEGTCTNPSQPEGCERMDCKTLSCGCDLLGGYVRNEKTDECVLTQNCPKSE